MYRTLRWVVIGLAVVAISGTTASAQQQKANIDAAKRAFKAGQQFMKMERYPDAIVEFKKAHAITQDDLVMGQIALGFEKAGDYEAALEAIHTYQAALPQADQASVDPLIAKYEKLIGEGKSTPLVLPGAQPKTEPLLALPSAGAMATQRELVEQPTERKRVWTWVTGGTAAALGVAALVTGLTAQSKFDEQNDICGPDQPGVCNPDDVDSAKTLALVTDILIGTAVAAGVAAIVLFFVEGHDSSKEQKKDDPFKLDDEDVEEEEDDALVKAVEVAPVAGAGTVGMGALLRF